LKDQHKYTGHNQKADQNKNLLRHACLPAWSKVSSIAKVRTPDKSVLARASATYRSQIAATQWRYLWFLSRAQAVRGIYTEKERVGAGKSRPHLAHTRGGNAQCRLEPLCGHDHLSCSLGGN
ncbi:MAG TPA: hypothetical protein VN494_10520, partial [Patescibacteria group bacterium]|nr:hypothetical protein [Patescibacteria group bacterium]